VLTLRIADLCEGHRDEKTEVPLQDLDFHDQPEFHSPISVDLHIEKHGAQIIVGLEASTLGDFTCDRCAEPFQQPVQDNVNLLYTSDPEMKGQEEDGIYYFSPSTAELDLTDPLRQTLILALPAKRICRETCRGLCPHCGVDLNHETCQCPTGHDDPRWDKLLNLIKG
jgi:uncharacterized protein